jgi:hypothetical protein
VIALENLMIGLLSQASDRQLDLVRDMAAYIRPRPPFTQHPLTIHAAAQMIHLVERAGGFRGATRGCAFRALAHPGRCVIQDEKHIFSDHSVRRRMNSDYATAIAWLRTPLATTLMVLLLPVLFYHMALAGC